MFKKCLAYSAFCMLFPASVSAMLESVMLGCDHKSLNRTVDAYVIAVEEKCSITEQGLQADLQFLSTDATRDTGFAKFISDKNFDELCDRGKKLPQVGELVNVCHGVFKKSQNSLEKAQACILLERVVLMLETVKSAGIRFIPMIFD